MIDRWYVVTCDGCRTSAEALPKPSAAWKTAERDGWTRDAADPWKVRHYCPDCTKGQS